METDRLQCYYCPKTFILFSDIIDHLCPNHKHEIIKYREKDLDDRTGRTGYRTKLYQDIIPSECSLSVTNDERLSITNEERSKKKKFNQEKPLAMNIKSVWRLILQSNCKEISSFLVIKISVGETAIYPLKLFPSIVWFDFSEIFLFLSVDQSKYFTKILGKLNKPNLLQSKCWVPP